ncbi:MAG: enoyl-CoA hydratase/isomerase family protein, partial [Actinomycetota bacterium]
MAVESPPFETLSARIDTDVDASGRVGRLTLERPDKLNPLSSTCLRELAEAAAWFDTTAASVVVVSGRGRAFSAGFDLDEFSGGATTTPVREQADLGRLMAEAMERMRALTIARISGPCVGGGLVLAATCDLRVAAADTTFVIPEVDLGIPLAWGGIPRLVRELPPAIVRELVLTCRPFDATEAARLGFVNRVVEPRELDAVVDDLARSLALKAPSVVRATKRQVNEAVEA